MRNHQASSRTAALLLLGLATAQAGEAAWKLVWAEEFNTPGLPDPKTWSYDVGFIRGQELQYYTEARPENVRVEDGCIVLEARKEVFPNPGFKAGAKGWQAKRAQAEYTSGEISTRGKAEWLYGRIEVRAKLPSGRGLFPAIWTLGKTGWPGCGEIDIMENLGHTPEVIYGTVHTVGYNPVFRNHKQRTVKVDRPYEDFHVYALEWFPDRLDFFVDQQKYHTVRNEGKGTDAWPFDGHQYLILNVAIGGHWAGRKGIDDAVFPQRMLVDYVRVYQTPLDTPTDPQDRIPPAPPAGLTASSYAPDEILLAWLPAADDRGVRGYEILRDGTLIGSTLATTYPDRSVQPGAAHTYTVRAVDVGANRSAATPPLAARPSGNLVENGGFEDGARGWDPWSGKEKAFITTDPANVAVGKQALRVVSGAEWGNYSLAKALKPGQKYAFSARTRVSPGSTGFATCCLQVTDGDGRKLIDEKPFAVTWSDYREVTCTFVAPARVADALIWVSKEKGEGDLYCDEVVLTAVP